MINELRKKKLKLRPVTYLSGSQGSDSDIPHGYIWSPHLVPKPKGYCFVFSDKNRYLKFIACITPSKFKIFSCMLSNSH